MRKAKALLIITLFFYLIVTGMTIAFATEVENSEGISLVDAVDSIRQNETEEAVNSLVVDTRPDYKFAQSKFGKVSSWVGKVKGSLLFITWIIAGLMTCLDIVCITIPSVRQYLAPQIGYGQTTGVSRFGAYGSGYNRYGGAYGMAQQTPYDNTQPVNQGNALSKWQWVSDSAIDTIMECSSGQTTGINNAPVKNKTKLLTYFKKRTFELILIIVVPLFLTSPIPYKIGFIIYNAIAGVNFEQIFNSL